MKWAYTKMFNLPVTEINCTMFANPFTNMYDPYPLGGKRAVYGASNRGSHSFSDSVFLIMQVNHRYVQAFKQNLKTSTLKVLGGNHMYMYTCIYQAPDPRFRRWHCTGRNNWIPKGDPIPISLSLTHPLPCPPPPLPFQKWIQYTHNVCFYECLHPKFSVSKIISTVKEKRLVFPDFDEIKVLVFL